jgi:hypothetical protein
VQRPKPDVLLRKKLDVEPLKKPPDDAQRKNSVDSKKKPDVRQKKLKLLPELRKRLDNVLKKPQG